MTKGMRARARSLAIVGVVSLVAGCFNADRFLEQYWEANCKWKKACETNFEDEFASIGQCVDEGFAQSEESKANCDYDRKQAKVCLEAAQAWFAECSGDYMKYQEYQDECGLVYDCPDDDGDGGESTGA